MKIRQDWEKMLYIFAYNKGKRELSLDDVVEFIESTRHIKYVPGSTTKQKLKDLLKNNGITPLKYREIARGIDEFTHPQTIKYHLKKLVEEGVVSIEENEKTIIYN